MKPRLRFWRGMWMCGLTNQPVQTAWAVGMTPKDAYELWARFINAAMPHNPGEE